MTPLMMTALTDRIRSALVESFRMDEYSFPSLHREDHEVDPRP